MYQLFSRIERDWGHETLMVAFLLHNEDQLLRMKIEIWLWCRNVTLTRLYSVQKFTLLLLKPERKVIKKSGSVLLFSHFSRLPEDQINHQSS